MNSPVDALHDENVTREKDRVDVEIYPPPSIYTPPPLFVAEQEVKVNKDSVSFFEVDERVAEIAPPFSDVHRVNVTPLIERSALTDVNSNTPPFPVLRLMFVKVLPLIEID